MITERVIGLTYEKAKELCGEKGMRIRILSNDGVENIVTRDLRNDRVNVRLEKGVVVKAKIG